MTKSAIQDLKQFIAATVHQEIVAVEDRLEEKISVIDSKINGIDSKLNSLDKKIDDKTEEILSAIADTTNDRFDIVEEDVKHLDTRVTKLESNPA